MIRNLVDLIETLNGVARHMPTDKRNTIKERIELLKNNMATVNHYANNLQEGISIIKLTVAQAENKNLLQRELSDLNFLLTRWEEKQRDLSKNRQQLQSVYCGQVVRGTILNKYF
jgi:hypothetical protein